MTGISEADWENAALDTLAEPLGWQPIDGEKIAPGTGEREAWDELLIFYKGIVTAINPDAKVTFEFAQRLSRSFISCRTSLRITTQNR